jgi:hypothetical protein
MRINLNINIKIRELPSSLMNNSWSISNKHICILEFYIHINLIELRK